VYLLDCVETLQGKGQRRRKVGAHGRCSSGHGKGLLTGNEIRHLLVERAALSGYQKRQTRDKQRSQLVQGDQMSSRLK